jgi:hypothetical protein
MKTVSYLYSIRSSGADITSPAVKEIFAVVCDGVTVGRPTCGSPRCTNRLRSPKDAFCPDHSALNGICRVNGCEENAEKGWKTCLIGEHRATESHYQEARKAAFQLKRRYEQVHPAEERESASSDEVAELDMGSEAIFETSVRTDKDGSKKKTLRAQLGRRNTHNEQLVFTSCGMALARRTFHFSESNKLVSVSLICVFRVTSLN